jgi:hypothetical protein
MEPPVLHAERCWHACLCVLPFATSPIPHITREEQAARRDGPKLHTLSMCKHSSVNAAAVKAN